ncbi:hypothetical protein [Pseudomonas sp. LP_7_YM]|uniref:hypothetical protein n=1 Tax=Pseudomonas sp. LP_7_YM TaxID=2485137 RepID=UPI00105DC4FC|nr:hypothetical protein [Pseudomonas sp. LP_7_YM]TDV59695.1 hypothetical protein EC915_11528 [Pseudomonas sp. LP_7_YM]
MTNHFIDYNDAAYLDFHMGYLRDLPRRIEAFKIKLGLVPAADYGKYLETALNSVVAQALDGSKMWGSSATRLRSLHLEARSTLTEAIEQTNAVPSAEALKRVIVTLKHHQAKFSRQRAECLRIIECASVIPRFIDFMNLRIVQYAARHGLLAGRARGEASNTLHRRLTPDENLVSATRTVQWNYRCYSTALLSAGNMAAYCGRLSLLLSNTVQPLAALDAMQSPRRYRLSCRLAVASAHEALRLIERTFDRILRFRL